MTNVVSRKIDIQFNKATIIVNCNLKLISLKYYFNNYNKDLKVYLNTFVVYF